MSATFGLVGTNPFTDFTSDDLEDLIYKHIGDNWSLTTPSDLTKAVVFNTTTKADMINRPFPFKQNYWLWVQFDRETASRTDRGSTLSRTGYILHYSRFLIKLYGRRLTKPSLTFPELGQMQREVARILWQYPLVENDIPGVQHFDNWEARNVDETNELGGSMGGTYRKTCAIDAIYWKASTI